jgi:hypothetical protein
MDRVMDCPHSMDRKEVPKFVYCFMILFLTIYILNIFYCQYHLLIKGVQ